MKNNFFTLFKTITLNSYKINKFIDRKNILKKSPKIILTFIVFIMILVYSSLYSYIGFDALKGRGLEKYVLIGFFCISLMITFVTSIYRSKSMIFDSNDNDALFSMPIKDSTIFSCRVLNLLSINYITAAFVFLPCVVMYSIFVKVSIMYFLMAFIVYLFLPFIPTTLAGILGYLVALLSSRMRNKKAFETIYTLGFIGLIMYGSNILPGLLSKMMENVNGLEKFMSTYGYVIDQMQKALFDLNIFSLGMYIFINFAFMYLFIKIFSNNYKKIINKLKEVSTKKNRKKVEYKTNKVITSLVKKEFRKFITTPIYLINTSFGVILLVIFTISNTFFDNGMIKELMNGEGLNTSMFAMILILTSFVVSLSNTACSSISLEGKSIWVLKSLPIKPKQIFNSKIILNLLVVLPLTAICIIVLGISLSFSIIQILLSLTIVSILSLVIAQFGVLINLKFPKVDFVSEAQVVKQSMSAFIAMFSPMVVLFSLMFLYSKLGNLSIEKYVCMISIVLVFVAIIQNNILNKWGSKAFFKI